MVLALLTSGLASGAAGDTPPIHCGIDSCSGPGTCEGVPGQIYGTDGKDKIVGTRRDDVIVALRGDDRIRGRGGDDLICGDGGDDFISGGAGEDGDPDFAICTCGPADGLYGGRGRDVITGDGGNDGLYGGKGGDLLQGGSKRDVCYGGLPRPDEFPRGDQADATCEEIHGAAETSARRGSM